jgi:HAD superfamily hydrolase (TIGR01509 family)
MLRAVLFDVDGTLVDSVDLHAQAWREAFARFRKQISFEKVRSQIGKGGDQLIPFFLSPDEVDRFGEDLDHFRAELWKKQYRSKVNPLPRVRELFERIRSDGRRIVLATSAKKEEIDLYIDQLGVRSLIEGMTTADDVEHSKPCPDVFVAALEVAQVESPKESIAVGDSPFDAEAAGRTGIITLGLLCGGFPESDLRRAGCVAIFKDPSDLLDRYADSPLAVENTPAARS